MINKNTIKAEFNKKFKDPKIKITSINHHSFGLFTVKVTKQMPKSVKITHQSK